MAPEKQGPRLLKNSEIRAAVAARVETAAISADEVLARLADTATSDLMDFIAIEGRGDWKVDLERIKRLGLGHLVKRLRKNKDGSSAIEREPRTAALIKLGEHYKLWKGETQAQLTLCELAKRLEDDDEDMPGERADRLKVLLRQCRNSRELFKQKSTILGHSPNVADALIQSMLAS